MVFYLTPPLGDKSYDTLARIIGGDAFFKKGTSGGTF
jgi:hypothetical protein